MLETERKQRRAPTSLALSTVPGDSGPGGQHVQLLVDRKEEEHGPELLRLQLGEMDRNV